MTVEVFFVNLKLNFFGKDEILLKEGNGIYEKSFRNNANFTSNQHGRVGILFE